MDDSSTLPVAAMPAPNVIDRGPSDALKAFLLALATAQGGFLPIEKNRAVSIRMSEKAGGGTYSFKYADLQEIHAKTRPALAAAGLSTSAQMIPHDEGVTLMLVLGHAEGYERTSEVFIKYGEDIKQFGGKLSYMRRYMLQNLLDVAADDDLDENGQEGDGGDAPAARRAPAPRATPARKTSAPAPVYDRESKRSNEPPPDDNPAPDESELQRRADVRTTGAAEARKRVVAGVDEKTVAEQTASINEQIPARQAPAPAADDDGELAEVGEINFLLKRCKTRGGDMAAVLADLGLGLDPATLQGLTRAQWGLIKSKV